MNKEMNLILKRYDRFKQELDSLITEYSDLSYKELADALEYYAEEYHRKALKEEYTYERTNYRTKSKTL